MSVVESLAHFCSQHQVVVVHGIIGYGCQLLHVHLSVFSQYRLINGHVDDPTHQAAGFRIVGDQLTFQRHGQLFDQRRVHEG